MASRKLYALLASDEKLHNFSASDMAGYNHAVKKEMNPKVTLQAN